MTDNLIEETAPITEEACNKFINQSLMSTVHLAQSSIAECREGKSEQKVKEQIEEVEEKCSPEKAQMTVVIRRPDSNGDAEKEIAHVMTTGYATVRGNMRSGATSTSK